MFNNIAQQTYPEWNPNNVSDAYFIMEKPSQKGRNVELIEVIPYDNNLILSIEKELKKRNIDEERFLFVHVVKNHY